MDEEEVSPGRPYKSVSKQSKDIDFVTVEGTIDLRSLAANFDQHFAGRKVEDQAWRDQELAHPVFAAVELERAQLLEGDLWSDWEVVPRTRIDPYKSLLNIPRHFEDLKYDITLLKL